MGTTAQKLQRVLDTKEGLKDTINTYLGQDITSAIPFKDYETYIKNFYNSLPKTDYAEGSNITLSNTLKGKLDFEDGIVGYGDTEQNGTPTPDSPQEIEVVRGKNLLDSQLEKGTYNDNTGEQIATDGNYRNVSPIKVRPNTTYTFSINGVKQKYCVYYYNSSNNFISWTPAETGTFTTPNNCYYINFRCYVADYRSDFANLKIQLEKGSQATSYLPYNTLEVVERGINWLPNNSTTQTVNGITYTINEDKSITISGTATARADIYLFGGSTDTGNYLHIPKGTYVLNDRNKLTNGSLFLAFREKTAGTKYETTTSDTAMELLANQDCYFYGVMLAVENGVTLNQMTFYPMVSNETTTYEPYQTPQTYQLSLGEYEFARIGNYVDTIEYDVDEDKVYKNKNIGKLVLNGSENWVNSSQFGYPNVFFVENLFNDISTSSDRIMLSTHFIYGGAIESSALVELNKFYMWKTLPYRLILGINFTQVAEIKSWLVSNNVAILYPLETPTKTEITDTTLINQIKALYNSQSFTGTTIIEIDGQLPLIIKVRALKGE